jgi:hypothetical protein
MWHEFGARTGEPRSAEKESEDCYTAGTARRAPE